MPRTDPDYDHLFKITIIGEAGVGKTALMKRFAEDTYQSGYKQTIGVDFCIRTKSVEDKNVKLQISDTAGCERFYSTVATYVVGAHGILIVFDMTSRDSFNKVQMHLSRAQKNKNAVITLVATKLDLGTQREVLKNEAEAFAAKNSINYIEISAKNYINVDDVFEDLAKTILNKPARTKVMLVGDAKVGKTALFEKIRQDGVLVEKRDYQSTTTADSLTKKLDEPSIKLDISDVPRRDVSGEVFDDYCKKSQVFIVTCDLTNRKSFYNIKHHIENIKANKDSDTPQINNPTFVLVGTKAHLIEQHAISEEEAKSIADWYGMPYVEVGKLEEHETKELLKTIASKAVENYHKSSSNDANVKKEATSVYAFCQQLKSDLDRYINRIEGHKVEEKIDFSHGFWVMRASREKNRMANYELAKALKSKLEKGPLQSQSIHDLKILFDPSSIKQIRNVGIYNLFQKNLPESRGVRSHELKGIIESVRNFKP